ncbi:YchJ family protein [Shewanella avicenniae]|uniref:YchJ family protein n=1 Tax=Shewanella avicenniae TaxID=2814294 RepID=A0ABX7QW61_9GAMM|nr:YchJ family protein [Shewanella avicenniae]QSX35145.1 YchJ family protein [Shewanella avicenniae]
MPTNTLNKPCPCGSGTEYVNCCGQLHQQQATAQTPEQLMRSRYSAFVLKQYQYLLDTHHADFCGALTVAQLAQAQPEQWLSLNVEAHSMSANVGQVRFCAWYRDGGTIDAIHEQSNFVLEDGRWFYTDGELLKVSLPGRNDPCVCGSGKKFKQCCLKR